MNKLQKIVLLFFVLSIASSMQGQKTPCFKRKKICNYQYLTNCYEKVAFDSVTNHYYSRSNLGTLFDGSCTTCHRNGVVEQQITIVEGKRHGSDTSYFASGCPYSSQNYVSGVLHGTSTSYFDSTNRVKTIVNHYMGLLYGPFIVFNRKGDTLKYQEYANNRISGIKKSYYDNSKIKKKVGYKDGLLHGSQINYSLDGKKELEVGYFEGLKHGSWIYYFDDESIAREEFWDKGKKHGDFITYNTLGKILNEQYYKKDLPFGTHKDYYMDSREKTVKIFGKKGALIEEYSFDEYGVKTINFQQVKKKKCAKKRKKKVAESNRGTSMD
tara:strand:+ start:171 stop:1148 length:978 start_codon:yes stop_codon:yes gene_type:complete